MTFGPERWVPAGVLNDGNPGTGLSATQASGGLPLATTLQVAFTALTVRNLGALDFGTVIASIVAVLSWGGAAGTIEASRVILRYSGQTAQQAIAIPVTDSPPPAVMIAADAFPEAPGGGEWTAAILDATEISVESDVIIPPASGATLFVAEAQCLAQPRERREVSVLAGDAVVEVLV